MLYPVISIRDAADVAEDEKLLFSPEQVDQIIANCLHEIAATYENDPVTRREIGTSYARYIQTLLIGRVSGRSRGRKKLSPESTGISPTVPQSEHMPSVIEAGTSVEPVSRPPSVPPPLPITPSLPADKESSPPPHSAAGPPPLPSRPRPRLASSPPSTATSAIGSPDGLLLGSSTRSEPVSPYVYVNGNGNTTTVIETTNAPEAQTQVTVAVDGNAVIAIEAEPDATLDEKLEDFLIITAYLGSYTVEPSDKTIAEFCKTHAGFEPKQVLQMVGIYMCSPMAFSRESCFDSSRYMHLRVCDLVVKCNAIPDAIEWEGQDEDLHIFTKTNLNADRLVNLAGVKLVRTRTIGNHLYFDKRTRTLYLFMTPGVTWNNNNNRRNFFDRESGGGFKQQFTYELARTYTLLFDCAPASRRVFNKFQATDPDLRHLLPSLRKRRQMISPLWTSENPLYNPRSRSWGKDAHGKPMMLSALDSMRDRNMAVFKITQFPYFGQRLLILEKFINEMKPTTWRELLKDSRDQLQYYTFMIAVVVFFMTALGLILAILQTAASFMQVFGVPGKN